MSRLPGMLGGFRRARSGVAALEFALVAPVMLSMLLSTIEITNAIRVQAKLNTAAGQLAELIAGQQSVTAPSGTLADLCKGALLNMLPFKSASFSADIASVTNDHPSNRFPGNVDSTTVSAYLDWENVSACPTKAGGSLGLLGAFNLANSPGSLLTKDGKPAATTADTNLQQGYSAIVVKAQYNYSNIAPLLMGSLLTFSATAVARPRTNVQIQCTAASGSSACPALQ